jgi:hypothetical protein
VLAGGSTKHFRMVGRSAAESPSDVPAHTSRRDGRRVFPTTSPNGPVGEAYGAGRKHPCRRTPAGAHAQAFASTRRDRRGETSPTELCALWSRCASASLTSRCRPEVDSRICVGLRPLPSACCQPPTSSARPTRMPRPPDFRSKRRASWPSPSPGGSCSVTGKVVAVRPCCRHAVVVVRCYSPDSANTSNAGRNWLWHRLRD